MNPWFTKANTSSASPTAASWWPFAGPLPLAVTLSHKCHQEPSAVATIHHGLHTVVLWYKLQAASELNSMYLRHEAKPEQSERQAFYLINLIISLAFKIHLRHRNASQSSSLVTWKSQDTLTCKLKGVYTPTSLTFLSLLSLQPRTTFWWNRELDFLWKTSKSYFFIKIPRQKQVTEDSFKQLLVICMTSLIPNEWHRKKELAPKARRYFNIIGIILWGSLSPQSYSELNEYRSLFFLDMKHLCGGSFA